MLYSFLKRWDQPLKRYWSECRPQWVYTFTVGECGFDDEPVNLRVGVEWPPNILWWSSN